MKEYLLDINSQRMRSRLLYLLPCIAIMYLLAVHNFHISERIVQKRYEMQNKILLA